MALGLLQDMRTASLARPELPLQPDSYTYSALLTLCQRTSNAELARTVVGHMQRDPSVQVREVHATAAMSACRRSGDPAAAMELLETLVAAPDVVVSASVVIIALKALAKSNSDPELALRAYTIISQFCPNIRMGALIYGLLIEVLATGGCVEEALTVLHEMEEEGHRPYETTYVMLVTACERGGMWRRSLSILEDMRRRGYVFYSNGLLDALFKKGVAVWNSAGEAFAEEELLLPPDG